MLYSSTFLCKYCPGCSLFILHNFTHFLGGLHSLILRFLLHPLLWLVVEVYSSTIISIRLFLRLGSYHELFFTMCSVQIFYPWKNLEGYVPTSGVPNPPRGQHTFPDNFRYLVGFISVLYPLLLSYTVFLIAPIVPYSGLVLNICKFYQEFFLLPLPPHTINS